LGNFTVGKIKTINGLPGEYALAIGEPFQSGLHESQSVGFKIFPNPSSGYFVIELNNSNGGQLNIASENGTIVYTAVLDSNINTIEWCPIGIEAGNYFVSQTNNQGLKIASATIIVVGK
jgi:hypothetical protein